MTTITTSPTSGLETIRAAGHKLAAMTSNRTAQLIATELLAAIDGTARGTMKAWMQARNGLYVQTLQVDNRTSVMWAPGARIVHSRPSTYVQLDGSRRDYAGMRVIAVTATALIVADDWHTIAYVDDNQKLDA